MTPELIKLDIADGIGTITFNRPEKMNAFNGEIGQEFLDALDWCDENDDIKAVIVTGEGRGLMVLQWVWARACCWQWITVSRVRKQNLGLSLLGAVL